MGGLRTLQVRLSGQRPSLSQARWQRGNHRGPPSPKVGPGQGSSWRSSQLPPDQSPLLWLSETKWPPTSSCTLPAALGLQRHVHGDVQAGQPQAGWPQPCSIHTGRGAKRGHPGGWAESCSGRDHPQRAEPSTSDPPGQGVCVRPGGVCPAPQVGLSHRPGQVGPGSRSSQRRAAGAWAGVSTAGPLDTLPGGGAPGGW